MVASTQTAGFLSRVRQSRLLGAGLVESIEQRLGLDDDETIANKLVEGRLLTRYQADKLLEGKSNGFYVGSYKVLEPICAGGMGIVYLAEHVPMKRVVALKVMRSELRGESHRIMRFEREARAMAAVDHPNVIQAIDFNEFKGKSYLVMPYIEGITAHQLVSQFGRLHWSHAANYVRQAAAGLQHIHDLGIVHRDIKPKNLLIDPDGRLTIIDFGLASSRADMNQALDNGNREIVGSWDFTSPEQTRDSRVVDQRTDVYSLGATFYFLVTGQTLFPDESSRSEKILAQRSFKPDSITDILPDFPPILGEIIHKMLDKNPAARFQTAKELFNELEAWQKPHGSPYDRSAVRITRDDLSSLLGRGSNETESKDETSSSSCELVTDGEHGRAIAPLGSTIAGVALDDTLKTTKPLVSHKQSPTKRRAIRFSIIAALATCLSVAIVLSMAWLNSMNHRSNGTLPIPIASLSHSKFHSETFEYVPVDPSPLWWHESISTRIEHNHFLDLENLTGDLAKVNCIGSVVTIDAASTDHLSEQDAIPLVPALECRVFDVGKNQSKAGNSADQNSVARAPGQDLVVEHLVVAVPQQVKKSASAKTFVGRIVAISHNRLLLKIDGSGDRSVEQFEINPNARISVESKPASVSDLVRASRRLFVRVRIDADGAQSVEASRAPLR